MPYISFKPGSTEEVMKEILRSARQQPVGSKERAELFSKYNEIKTKYVNSMAYQEIDKYIERVSK